MTPQRGKGGTVFLYLEPLEHDEPWMVEVYLDPRVAMDTHPGDWHQGHADFSSGSLRVAPSDHEWYRRSEPNDSGVSWPEAYIERREISGGSA